MSNIYYPGESNQDVVELVFPDADGGPVRVSQFVEYSFNSHFLTPTDGFSFVMDSQAKATRAGAEGAFDAIDVMTPGARVELQLNGYMQSTGFIDSVEISASRDGGLMYRVEGQDVFSQLCNTCADPTTSFKPGQTLFDVVKTMLGPFGFKEFFIDNDANRDILTNSFRAKTAGSNAKGFGRRALKDYKAHQSRPYPEESVFQFVSRHTQRAGLWIWPTADGKQVVVAKPDFDQKPDCMLLRYFGVGDGGLTNVLHGSVKFNLTDQPTAIVADSYSKGGEYGPGRVKTILKNAAVRVDPSAGPPPFQKYIDAGANVLPAQPFSADESPFGVMTVPRHRVIYKHDDESMNQDQLESYVRREMALLQQKSVTAHYTVEGHGQFTPAGYRSWAVDTTVTVRDEVARFAEVMYVLSRTFNKSRENGTTTDLQLIRLNTLVFSDSGK